MYDLHEWRKVWWTVRYQTGSLLLLLVLVAVLVGSLVWLLYAQTPPYPAPVPARVGGVLVAAAPPLMSSAHGRRP